MCKDSVLPGLLASLDVDTARACGSRLRAKRDTAHEHSHHARLEQSNQAFTVGVTTGQIGRLHCRPSCWVEQGHGSSLPGSEVPDALRVALILWVGGRGKTEMGLRRLFQRKAATSAPLGTDAAAPTPAAPMSPELQEELRVAWAELTEAANASKVTNFHACSRTGRPWTEDPVAVRAVAATLREFPDTDIRADGTRARP